MSKGKYILSLSGILFLVMLLVAGATFAYQQWASDADTIINVTAGQDITMTITPTTVSKSGMRPTNDCDGTYAMVGTATVQINNLTGMTARPIYLLKAKSSKALNNNIWKKINYAIVDSSISGKNTCDTTDFRGSFIHGQGAADTWYHTEQGIAIGSTFDVAGYNGGTAASPSSAKEKTYTVYVWIDSTYTHVNTGSVISDPLQDTTLTVTWSEKSLLTTNPSAGV